MDGLRCTGEFGGLMFSMLVGGDGAIKLCSVYTLLVDGLVRSDSSYVLRTLGAGSGDRKQTLSTGGRGPSTEGRAPSTEGRAFSS